MKGRPVDPTRRSRATGNRPQAGEAKLTLVPAHPTKEAPVSPILDAQPPPWDLPAQAEEIWNAAMLELAGRHLKTADLEALRMMCVAAARARQAATDIANYGLIVEGKHGPIVNPLTRVEKDATATYLRLAEQYGLTLAARLRLGLMQLAGESMLQALNDDLDAEVVDIAVGEGRRPSASSPKRPPAKKAPTKRSPAKKKATPARKSTRKR